MGDSSSPSKGGALTLPGGIGVDVIGGGLGAPFSFGPIPFDTGQISTASSGNTQGVTNTYNQLGLGGSTAEQTDLGAIANQVGTGPAFSAAAVAGAALMVAALVVPAPARAVAQGLRAEALFRLGRFGEVIKAFDSYIETGKPRESVYQGRGLARAELGQYPGAIDDFTKALELKAT